MRPQCAIVLAAAIILADTDISAATHVKSIQGSNASTRRLIRSETSADVDGEERVNPFKSIVSSSSQAKEAADFSKLNKKWDAITRNKPLEELSNTRIDEWLQRVGIYNREHSGTLNLLWALRKKYPDEDIMKWIDTIEDNSQLDEILVKEWFFEKKTLHFVEDLEKKVVKKRTEEIIEKDFNVDEELKKVKEHRWTYMYGKKVTNALNEIILKLQEPRSHTNINLGEDVALEKEKKVLEDILGFNE